MQHDLLGYYHVSWGAAGDKPAQRRQQLTDLRTLARAGFRLMHASHLGDLAFTRRLLDEAAKLGMRLLLEDVDPYDRPSLLGHPALLGLSVADDANTKAPERLRELCGVDAPRYLSLGATPDGAAWCYGLTEFVGFQVYPYPWETLGDWWPALAQARTLADAHGQTFLANLQAHVNGHPKAPTASQTRALGWLAAAAGADGVLWYAQQEPGPRPGVPGPRVSTTLWSASRQVSGELRRVTGRPQDLTRTGDRLTATWPQAQVTLDLARSQVVRLRWT